MAGVGRAGAGQGQEEGGSAQEGHSLGIWDACATLASRVYLHSCTCCLVPSEGPRRGRGRDALGFTSGFSTYLLCGLGQDT